jgi:hypothetical protein
MTGYGFVERVPNGWASMNPNLRDKIFLSSGAEAQRKVYEQARKKSTLARAHVGQWPNWMPAFQTSDEGKRRKRIAQTR